MRWQSAGGDQLVQIAAPEPGQRELVGRALGELSRGTSIRAAARGTEGGGRPLPGYRLVGGPYPVAERLSRPRDMEVDALVVVADARPAAAVACLDLRLAAVDLMAAARWPRPGRSTARRAIGLRHRTRPGARSTDRPGGRGARPGPRLLDAARDARPGHGPDKGLRARTRAVRPAPGLVPGRAVPADRRRGRARRRGGAGQVRPLERPDQPGRRAGRRACPPAGDPGGGRRRLPDRAPAARRHRLLRRDHAVLGFPLQPAAAPPAARPVGDAVPPHPAAGPTGPHRVVQWRH